MGEPMRQRVSMGTALLVRISSANTTELGSNNKMMVEPPNWKYPCSSPLFVY